MKDLVLRSDNWGAPKNPWRLLDVWGWHRGQAKYNNCLTNVEYYKWVTTDKE